MESRAGARTAGSTGISLRLLRTIAADAAIAAKGSPRGRRAGSGTAEACCLTPAGPAPLTPLLKAPSTMAGPARRLTIPINNLSTHSRQI